MGTPHLYAFTFNLYSSSPSPTLLDSRPLTTGLRSIHLLQTAEGKGESFKFVINGQQFYAKGANYVPRNYFLPMGLRHPQIYEDTILAAVQANMNMIRVWGGGQFELDVFYELCDKHGLLIWHDFMFANTLYPGTTDFIDSIVAEVQDNLRRIRHHPSIGFWNGNNEVLQGWREWGWGGMNGQNNQVTWSWYQKIFERTLPDLLAIEMPGLSYIPSSPLSNQYWGNDKGNVHYWLVWWGSADLETYETHLGRFNSEYGMQSMMPLSSVKLFVDADKDLNKDSPIIRYHNKHSNGMGLITRYIDSEYKTPKNFEDFLYLSMCMQAYGVGIRIESTRRMIPYSMGSLYWQLNDVWPSFSWSSLDFYGQWKALQFRAKHLYSQVMISIKLASNSNFQHNIEGANVIDGGKGGEGDRVFSVSVVNDGREEVEGVLEVEVINFKGKILAAQRREIKLPKVNNTLLYVAFGNNIAIDKTNTYVRAKLTPTSPSHFQQPTPLLPRSLPFYHNFFFYGRPKMLSFPDPLLQITWPATPLSKVITFSSSTYASYVYLYIPDDITLKLSENFFDLTPGWPVEVTVLSNHTVAELKDKMKVKTVYDTL